MKSLGPRLELYQAKICGKKFNPVNVRIIIYIYNISSKQDIPHRHGYHHQKGI